MDVVGGLACLTAATAAVTLFLLPPDASQVWAIGDAERLINARLEALLRGQEAVLQGDGGAGLQPLLERALEPFDLARFEIAASPEVRLQPDVAVGLGLLFHELATNALKHGALSAPEGRIRIAWTLETGLARFTWRETGGPAVAPRPAKGSAPAL